MIMKAFEQLRRRDKIVLLLTAFFLLVGISTVIVDVFRGNGLKKVQFPESLLTETADGQVYEMHRYKELPIQIKFPNLPYGVSVVGVETMVTESGYTFSHGMGRYLCALETGKDMPMSEIMRSTLSNCLYGEEGAKYKSHLSDSGFLNTLNVDYECGVLSMDRGIYYVISYRYHTDENYDIVLAVADRYTEEMSENMELLNHMFYSMCLMDNPVKEDVEPATRAADEQELEITDKRIKEVVAQIDEQMHEGRYAKWCEKEIVLDEPLEDAYFLFSLTAVKMPSEVYLVAPNGTVFREYMVDEYESCLIFPVQKAMKGTWRILVSVDNRDMGVVQFDVMTRETYDALHDFDKIAETSIPHPVE